MEFLIPSAHELRLGVRALKTVALADGEIKDAERSVLEAALSVFGGTGSVDEIEPIAFRDLATELRPELLRQLLGGVLIVCMADGEVNDDEVETIRAYAGACNIDDATVASMRRTARGEFRTARLDIIRRHWTPEELRNLVGREESSVYFKAVSGMLNLRDDAELTRRYRDLGTLAVGTLGRAYFDYVVENAFPFPGERGAPPESMVLHDMTHILSGYGTDPKGEVLTASFTAGYSRLEMLNWFMFVLAQFQLGVTRETETSPAQMSLEPRDLVAAARRGAAMNLDLGVGWSHFDVIGDTVVSLRERYGIRPHEQFQAG